MEIDYNCQVQSFTLFPLLNNFELTLQTESLAKVLTCVMSEASQVNMVGGELCQLQLVLAFPL